MDDREQAVSIEESIEQDHTKEAAAPSAEVPMRRDAETFLTELIKQQCELIEAMAGIILVRPMRDQGGASVVKYESDAEHAITSRDYKRLAALAAKAAREDRALIDSMAASQGLLSHRPDYHVLAAPLRLAGKPQGASVCIVPYRESEAFSNELKRLELSGLKFESYLWREQAYSEAQSKIQLRETLDLVDRSYHGHTAQEMASIFASEIQRRFGCDRVSIGLIKGHAVRLVAMSGTEDVDRKSELTEALEAVMEECADQDTEVRYPQPEEADPLERRVVRAHASLSERFGPVAAASFPLRIDDGLIGVVVMERNANDPFNDATLHLLRLVAEYIGPTIWTRRLADRGILAVSRDRTIELGETLVGPKKTGAKMLALIALLLVVVSIVVPVRDRVVGDGRIVAEIRRQISAPFQGQVAEVLVDPGDEVEAGQPLVRLDVSRIQLQKAQKENEYARLGTQADEARTKGKIHEAMMIERQREVVRADIELFQYQLEQAEIASPIAGTVTQSRLDDLVGEVVTPERPLLSVEDLDSIVATVLVPERSIARVKVGQEGTLSLSANPSVQIPFTVVAVTPASEVVQQKNVYSVMVTLDEQPDWLRPGMEGKSRIRGDWSNLFMIYTRPLIDAIRMRVWLF